MFTRKLCSGRSFYSGYPYTIMSKLQVVLFQKFFFPLSRFLLNALLLSCSYEHVTVLIELLIVAFSFKPHFYYWLLNTAQLLFSVNSSFLFFCYEEAKGLERMCSSRFIPLYTSPALITLAWKIPWTEEPGRLQSTGSLRIGHNWVISLSLFTFMHWRRKWQPTPVFLPGESQGQEPSGLPSMGSHRVGHDWSDLAAAAAAGAAALIMF